MLDIVESVESMRHIVSHTVQFYHILVKVVTLTTPTHVANLANEWLLIQTYVTGFGKTLRMGFFVKTV